RNGTVTPLPLPAGPYPFPRPSPHGERIAFFAARGQSIERDIWIYDLSRQNATRLTFQNSKFFALLSPDSKRPVVPMRISWGSTPRQNFRRWQWKPGKLDDERAHAGPFFMVGRQ